MKTHSIFASFVAMHARRFTRSSPSDAIMYCLLVYRSTTAQSNARERPSQAIVSCMASILLGAYPNEMDKMTSLLEPVQDESLRRHVLLEAGLAAHSQGRVFEAKLDLENNLLNRNPKPQGAVPPVPVSQRASPLKVVSFHLGFSKKARNVPP